MGTTPPKRTAPRRKPATDFRGRVRERTIYRFSLQDAGPHWAEHRRLARACDEARLTVLQAEAALLGANGWTFREICADLNRWFRVPLSYQQTRDLVKAAAGRLMQTHHKEERDAIVRYAEILRCLRNRLKDEDFVPGSFGDSGGMPRVRPAGAAAEDIVHGDTSCPLSFLRDFNRRLQSAVRS